MILYTPNIILDTTKCDFVRYEDDCRNAYINYDINRYGIGKSLKIIEGNIFNDAAGVTAYYAGDDKGVKKYRLSLDTLWSLTDWHRKFMAKKPVDVTKQMREIQEKIKAEEHERRIHWLKKEGLYDAYMAEKMKAGQGRIDSMYKEKMQRRLYKLVRAMHAQGYTANFPIPYEATDLQRFRLRETATGERPELDSPYRGYFTISQLEEMFGTAEH